MQWDRRRRISAYRRSVSGAQLNNPADISVTRRTTLRDALAILDRAGTGLLLLTGEDGCFERTVTDGDLRRLILGSTTLNDPLERLPHIDSVVLSAPYTR